MGRLTDSALAELGALCPGGVFHDVELSALSWWQIGGRADLMLRPSSANEIAALMRWFAMRGIRPLVIGQATNLLFDDAGLRVPCIQIGKSMAEIRIDGPDVYADAGIWVPGLARRLMQAGLGGAEHICGIPGTLGGLVCMNGGSQRKGIGSHIAMVESVDAEGTIRQRNADVCGFAYRQSIYQENHEIITGTVMRFGFRPIGEIRAEMLDILADRRRKFPRKQPNCGSVFVSDPATYAQHGPPGEIVEKLGLKGRRSGGAQVSPLHANFIVNTGGARANDVLTLIHEISGAAARELGATLRAEVRYVAPDGSIFPATDATQDLLGETR
ncbi:UDP-N-acetylmuramate dehydrogenase [Rhodobacter sp. NSM]|uniref:UDP-N-acetylmuramate dehydrogenase n=1 Tax=Rhodobacter sp. NSM TaxID=3457501 RepID=UPI003FD0FCF5